MRDEEAGNEREEKKMNQRTRLWVRTTGWVGRLPPYGEVWQRTAQFLLVPRFVRLFVGIELSFTVLNCSCHILLWGYLCLGVCQGFLNRVAIWGALSVQDGIVRQKAASVHLGCFSDCIGASVLALGSLGLYWDCWVLTEDDFRL